MKTIAILGATTEGYESFCRELMDFFVKPCRTGTGEGLK
jgi:hypothetical protein